MNSSHTVLDSHGRCATSTEAADAASDRKEKQRGKRHALRQQHVSCHFSRYQWTLFHCMSRNQWSEHRSPFWRAGDPSHHMTTASDINLEKAHVLKFHCLQSVHLYSELKQRLYNKTSTSVWSAASNKPGTMIRFNYKLIVPFPFGLIHSQERTVQVCIQWSQHYIQAS